MNCSDCPHGRRVSRRTLLKSLIGVAGAGLSLADGAAAAPKKKDDPRRLPPQAGDELVYPFWENDGRLITLDDIPLGGPPVLAYPRDAASQVARDRSRLNQILLVRFTQQELSPKTRQVAVDGIIAYSGVCTHTGCNISEWNAEHQHFVCPCHSSAFDPKDRARIHGGPAPKPLPVLPLQLVGGSLRVAGPFSGRVGGKRT